VSLLIICKAIDDNSALSSMPLPTSILLPQRPRGELDQGRHFPTGSSEIPQKFLTAHLLFAKRYRCHKILHLEVIDEWMFAVESAGRFRQTATFQYQPFTDRSPLLRPPHDSRSYSGKGGIVWVPDSCSSEAICGFEVQVIHGCMGILAASMMKMNTDMCLEGTLICGEPDVSINAK
jgi:hypothetical protein